jgi:FtsP/CotA-like multicopper oxidase with cupredoxin domain
LKQGSIGHSKKKEVIRGSFTIFTRQILDQGLSRQKEDKKMSRRRFSNLCFLVATVTSLIGFICASGVMAQIPGGTLDPTTIPKYVSPLVIPPAMPAKFKSQPFDYYEIAVRQFQQQILPTFQNDGVTPIPPTTVWSYGPAGEKVGDNLGKHATAGGHYFYPAFTIEAKHDKPVRVKWVNELKHANGNFRSHLLAVDQTLHWANPPGGKMMRDMRPMFMETPGPYTGPVPIVTHLHGAVAVGDESDGYPEAWFLPAANNIPDGFATEGTWYDFFKVKSLIKFHQPWDDGYAVFQYPNKQRATTLWYHDHTLGMTRVNVYAGPAGFYLVRGGAEDLNLGYNPPSGTLGAGVKPGTITEIPIAIQDRSFNEDGSLFFPDSRAFFDGFPGPYIPVSDISPIHNPEFFGNTMVVNGQSWPVQNVEPRRYRFRFLNGCNSRFLILRLVTATDINDPTTWTPITGAFNVLGTEGGFLPNVLVLDELLVGLAERFDVVVDFAAFADQDVYLVNVGPDEPFGGGVPGVDFAPADPGTTGQVLKFAVGTQKTGKDKTTPPAQVVLPPVTPVGPPTVIRKVSLNEVDSEVLLGIGPRAALLGTMDGGNFPVIKEWMDAITENPALGVTELWEIYNFTADAHPIHVHEVHFQVVDRQLLAVDADGMSIAPAQLVGPSIPPEVWEDGAFKDTVIAYPGQVTRLKARFVNPGLFVWHCHIIDHEDNEMMRPYFIGGPLAKLPYHLYIRRLGRNLF